MTDLERVQARGQLFMLTQPGPTTYFEDGRGANGFEYIIAKAFADSLGVDLVVKIKPTLESLFFSVGGPQGDFVAANITQTETRNKSLVFTSPFHQITQQLIYSRSSERPRSVAQLSQLEGDLLVISNSSHSERLRELQVDYPELKWREQANLDMGELMRMLNASEINYTIIDSLAYQIHRHLYPRARKAMDISEPQPMAWAFASHGDGTLLEAANNFLEEYKKNGKLDDLKKIFSSQAKNFSVANSQQLGKLVKERLPTFEKMFQKTAEAYNLDWHLLAAIAYQESHWNPRAKSPTGVRGLMMLTQATAKEMKVKNRLDPLQSILGGTAYFVKLKSRLPERITEPDRTWFTLAAYNVGFGHLEDARVLTQRAGKNPDNWNDVRDHLPLLSKKVHYSTVRHGYARGWEPVVYVDNIQYFIAYLKLHSIALQETKDEQTDLENLNQESLKTPSSL